MITFRSSAASAAAAGLLLLAGQAVAETPAQMEANKKVVIGYIHEVFNAEDVSKIDKFLDKDYVQHNPNFSPPGVAGVKAVLGKRFPKPKAPADVRLSQFDKVDAAGDLVWTMLTAPRADPNAPGKTYDSYWFDLFRVKNGKIVEHWDSALKTSPGAGPRD